MKKYLDEAGVDTLIGLIYNEIGDLQNKINSKSSVMICDNQYEFDQILTKDNNTIYLIKGDQDTWAAKEYVDELYDLNVELRNRIKVLEALNGINNEVSQDEPST